MEVKNPLFSEETPVTPTPGDERPPEHKWLPALYIMKLISYFRLIVVYFVMWYWPPPIVCDPVYKLFKKR